MSNRTTLRRLEHLAQHQLAQQDDAQRRERERWEAMSDEELARYVDALARGLKLIQDEELLALVDEWQHDAFSD